MVPLKIGHFYIKKLHEKWCPPFLSFSRIGCLRVNAINFLIYGGINTDIMRKTLFWWNGILIVVKWVFLVEKAKKLDLNTPIMVEFLFEKN